jgi:hypothetical protein
MKMDLTEIRREEVIWISVAQERSRWLTVVNTGTYLLV